MRSISACKRFANITPRRSMPTISASDKPLLRSKIS